MVTVLDRLRTVVVVFVAEEKQYASYMISSCTKWYQVDTLD